MNIAYFITCHTWGGVEQYIYNLAKYMQEQYGVHTFFLFTKNCDAPIINRFASLGKCEVFKYAHSFWRFIPFAGQRLAKILDAWNIDVLHINSTQTYFIATRAKHLTHKSFRLIVTQHLVKKAKNDFLRRDTYRQIDELICVSHCVYNEYLKPFQNNRIFPSVNVVYNSVPIFQRIEKTITSPKIIKIIYHGRICKEKGIEPLFIALSQLCDLPFTITFVGGIAKEDKKWWNRLLTNSPVREKIKYDGFSADVYPFLQEHHIGVLPSIVKESGGPLSLIEDMAFGLAIIASDNGSQPEFIEHGKNGLLCPANDPNALAATMRNLIENVSLIQSLGTQAQNDFFEQHTYKQFIQNMYNLYSNKK